MIFKVLSYYILLYFIVCQYITIIQSLQVVPSRSNVTYYDPKYVKDPVTYVSRYGRKSPYFLNVDSWLLHEWNNNVTITLLFNEYLNHEYRRSFVELSGKFCNFFNHDQYIGLALLRAGLSCPAPAGHYPLLNISFPTENFPNVFPFKKARVDINFLLTANKKLLASGFVEVTLINPNMIKAKPKS